MKFTASSLPGAYLIELEKHSDERGFFARAFCQTDFANQDLENSFVQINDSYNLRRGTLRGLHYQIEPAAETKIVRCIAGALWDVILDLRPKTPTFGRWFAV